MATWLLECSERPEVCTTRKSSQNSLSHLPPPRAVVVDGGSEMEVVVMAAECEEGGGRGRGSTLESEGVGCGERCP